MSCQYCCCGYMTFELPVLVINFKSVYIMHLISGSTSVQKVPVRDNSAYPMEAIANMTTEMGKGPYGTGHLTEHGRGVCESQDVEHYYEKMSL